MTITEQIVEKTQRIPESRLPELYKVVDVRPEEESECHRRANVRQTFRASRISSVDARCGQLIYRIANRKSEL